MTYSERLKEFKMLIKDYEIDNVILEKIFGIGYFKGHLDGWKDAKEFIEKTINKSTKK